MLCKSVVDSIPSNTLIKSKALNRILSCHLRIYVPLEINHTIYCVLSALVTEKSYFYYLSLRFYIKILGDFSVSMKRTREFTSLVASDERFMVNTSFISECSSTQTTNLRSSYLLASRNSRNRQYYEQNRESPAILGGRSSLDEMELSGRDNRSHHSNETPRSSTFSTKLEERRFLYTQQREQKRITCKRADHSPYNDSSISSNDSNMYTSPTRDGMYTTQKNEEHNSPICSKAATFTSEARIQVADKMDDTNTCRQVYFNYDPGNATYRNRSNAMMSYRYTILTAVPLILHQIFTKASNVYFFIICVVQSFPQISNAFGYPSTVPAFLLLICLEFIISVAQDQRRRQSCEQVNRMKTHILRNKSFQDVLWRDVKVGDFIQVRHLEMVPADILLLAVSDPIGDGDGVCFVETRQVDGAIHRKTREVLPCTTETVHDAADLLRLRGVARYNTNSVRSTFEGVADVSMENSQEMQHIPFALKNVLLRGHILRDTEFIYGLVLGTGADTKLLKSNGQRWKRSELMCLLDKVVGILCIHMVVSFAIAASFALMRSSHDARESPWYLYIFKTTGDSFLVIFFSLLLSCYPIVPISVCVSVTSVKLIQAMYIMWEAQVQAQCAKDSSALGALNLESHEQLGRISHLFIDKNGTLTRNCMRLRKCSVNGISYALDLNKECALSSQLEKEQRVMELVCEQKDGSSGMYTAEREKMEQFLEHLSVCHNISSDAFMNGKKASCDDEALLAAAASMGFICKRQSNKHISLKVHGVTQTFEILEQLFDNRSRGRVSIVLRRANGDLFLYCKGTGSQMYSRLRSSDRLERLKAQTQQHVNEYAKEGLRTVVLAVKKLEKAFFAKWQKSYVHAQSQCTAMKKQRECSSKLDAVINELESDLEVIGAIGVEHELEDKVPECVQSLTEAGIRIWMLTGDNEEMAISSGYASTLLSPSAQQIVLTASTCDAIGVEAFLEEALNSIRHEDDAQIAIITDGAALDWIINRQLMSAFLDIAIRCRVVIAGGMSPAQKGKLVRLVRQNVPSARTLAIGNGSSDIAMMLAADVGVSLQSRDTMQTVILSDYAIPQFYFIQKLLLVHGRWSYLRLSKVVHYILYANFTLFSVAYLQSAIWGYHNASVYWETSIHLYSTLFITLPILTVAILDQDVSADVLMEYPFLYRKFASENLISISTCFGWFAAAVYDAVVIIVFISIGSERSDSRVEMETYVVLLIIFIINAKLCFLVNTWTLLLLGVWASSMMFWLMIATSGAYIPFVVNRDIRMEGFGAFWLVMSWNHFLGLVLALSIVIVSGIAWNQCNCFFHAGLRPEIPQAAPKLSVKIRRLSVPELEEHTVSMSLDHVSALYTSTESPHVKPNTSAEYFSDAISSVKEPNRLKKGSKSKTRGRVASTIHEHVEKKSDSIEQYCRVTKTKDNGKTISTCQVEGSESDQLEQSFSVSVYSSSIVPTSSAFEKLSVSQRSKGSSYPYRSSPFSCEEDTILTESYVFRSGSKRV